MHHDAELPEELATILAPKSSRHSSLLILKYGEI